MATVTRTTQARPDEVFAVLSDGWLYPGWVVGASRMRRVDHDWPKPRAELHHSFGVWPFMINDRTTMLEWEFPRRARLKARGWPLGTAIVEIELEQIPAGTKITITENPDQGPGRLVPKPVRDPMIGIRNVETLRRLALLAEGRAERTPQDPA
jgi:hypothetical protein